MNRHARYEAFIPPEPLGLTIVRDRDDDVWQRRADGVWRCTANKVGMLFGMGNHANWRAMLLDFGPLYPVEWSDPPESEQGGTPDAGQPDRGGVG